MIDKLLLSILENTKNGTVTWNRTNSMFNTEKSHQYKSELNDGSKLVLTIELDDLLRFNYCSILDIINPNLVEGHLYIHSSKYANVTEIAKSVYDMYIKKTIVSKLRPQEDVLSDIMSSISKEQIRDERISTIIDEPITEIKIEKESIYNKLRKLFP